MTKSKIGAQLYTLRDYTKTPADIAQILKKVRKIGYEVVQISAIGPIDIKELRKILDGEGLYPCSTHTGYERLLKEIENMKKMGFS